MGSPQLETIRGIVLRTVKYGDSSVVVDLFTQSHGRMAVMTHRMSPTSMRSGARTSPTHLMPLSMVEMQCGIHGSPVRMPHPRSMSSYHVYTTLHTHTIKGMILMFVAEFLSKTLREETPDPLLYQYIEQSLLWLDAATADYANFHLVLLMRMTRFLGIEPPTERHAAEFHYFDLQNSEYTRLQPLHSHFLHEAEAQYIPYIMHMNFDNMHLYPLSHNHRYRILEVIIEYYRLHIPGFSDLKSLDILRELSRG